jgi:restriction endonuclease S subunit
MAKSNWQTFRFDQIAHNIAKRIDPAEADTDIYVGLEHLDPESLHIKRWGTPADVKGTKLCFYKGDIIFGRRRAYQRKLAMAEFDGICSAHAMVLRANTENVLPEFLPFFMQSDTFFERALKISVGSLSPTINWKALAQQEFTLPPLDEQCRIAEILWAADEVIQAWWRSLEGIQEKLKAIRTHIVCSSDHPRKIFNDYLIDLVPGRSVVGVQEPANQDEFGVLKVSAVGANGFVPEENKTLINPNDFHPEYQVKANDLLITRANTRELVGRVCIVPQNYDNLMLCDKTIRIDVSKENWSKHFLLEAFRSREVRIQIEGRASGTGGAMKNISQSDICSLQIPMPPIDTQRKIASVIQEVTKSRRAIEKHLQETNNLQKSLINNLVTQTNDVQ